MRRKKFTASASRKSKVCQLVAEEKKLISRLAGKKKIISRWAGKKNSSASWPVAQARQIINGPSLNVYTIKILLQFPDKIQICMSRQQKDFLLNKYILLCM